MKKEFPWIITSVLDFMFTCNFGHLWCFKHLQSVQFSCSVMSDSL